MKQMILLFVVGLVTFSASAGVSWYLGGVEASKIGEAGQTNDEGHPDHKTKVSTQFIGKGHAKAPATLDPYAAPTARVTAPNADSVAQLAGSLRQQQESLRGREQSLLARQKHLELIHQDLRNERKTLDELRQQVNEELKALAEKLDAVERKTSELDKKKQEIGKQTQEFKQTVFEVDSVEQKNLKRMAVSFDSMDADTAGELLQQMADGGKLDMAVKILSSMQERQVARVLSQMPDRATAVLLLEKMKSLQRPAAAP